MGEFAGYALDETMDAEADRMDYRFGLMSDFEAFDRGIIDHQGFSNSPPMFRKAPTIAAKTCRACGAGGLRWAEHGGKWRLHCGTELHTCAQYRPGS